MEKHEVGLHGFIGSYGHGGHGFGASRDHEVVANLSVAGFFVPGAAARRKG